MHERRKDWQSSLEKRERIVECVSIDDIDGTDDRPIRERGACHACHACPRQEVK